MTPFQIKMLRYYQDDASNRRYHGVNHILDLLQLFRTNCVVGLAPLMFTNDDVRWFSMRGDGLDQLFHNPESVEAAIYGHDAVYDSNRSDNEWRSCVATLSALRFHPEPMVKHHLVEKMIIASKTHDISQETWSAETTNDVGLFLSLDLAQLAATEEVFNQNTDDIRYEYRQFSDQQWAIGRKAFFEKMLNRETIYPHPLAEASWGDLARKNMERGLKRLNS